jgi:hypothetical protein
MRCAPVEMTKERVAADREVCYWNGALADPYIPVPA